MKGLMVSLLREEGNHASCSETLCVSSPIDPGSGTTSSISCPPSPKLLDSFAPDAPNTPITPFTNRGSGNITENTSPLELDHTSSSKELSVVFPEAKTQETPSPLVLSQEQSIPPSPSIPYFDTAISVYSNHSNSELSCQKTSCRNDMNETALHCGLTTTDMDQETAASPLLVNNVIPSHEATFASKKRTESSEHRGRPAACLFVASLSSSRTDEQLCISVTNHFRKWGNLLNVKVLKDWMQRPYSFVQFENFDDAKRALREAHNTVIDGRHIRVEK
ncbi:hypothetical protein PCK1_000721 [Pneumocystis canis]|nr:hypothetical protein PCK1_000721 [Pneumocystis canis]